MGRKHRILAVAGAATQLGCCKPPVLQNKNKTSFPVIRGCLVFSKKPAPIKLHIISPKLQYRHSALL